jgi:hypothetical protein
MTRTTTIEVTMEQRERLREIDASSAKASVSTLLEIYDRTPLSFEDVVAASEQGTRRALEDHQ